MQICEYDDIRCPYCGERDKLRVEMKTEMNQHTVRCLSCLGLFWITCED